MQGITGKAAQTAQVFQEIPGESVSARRVRYWKWKKVQAKLQGKNVEYCRGLTNTRKTTISHLTAQLRDLTRQFEAMRFELTANYCQLDAIRCELIKRGYTFPVGE